MTKLKQAIELAKDVHVLQVDKAGKPYIFHPVRVMQRLNNSPYVSKILAIYPIDMDILYMAAVLHDVAEDTPVSLSDIAAMNLDETGYLIELLTLLKKDKKYFEYIADISKNPHASLIKLMDLEDNLDPLRIEGEVTDQIRSLWNRYTKAKIIIVNALNNYISKGNIQ